MATNQHVDSGWLTIFEVATRLKVSVQWVRQKIRNGAIIHVVLESDHTGYRISPSELHKFRRMLPNRETRRAQEWFNICTNVVHGFCCKQNTFSSDDVWNALIRMNIPEPPRRSAMGNVMKQAVLNGWCDQSAGYTSSKISRNKGRKILLYKPLLSNINTQ